MAAIQTEVFLLEDVYIGLGSNMGDRQALLEKAVAEIGALPETRLVAHSQWLETEPVGGPPEQDPYLNGAAKVFTALEPEELLEQLNRIESRLGRIREEKWGPRPVDLDILLFGNRIVCTPDLTIPHPLMHERRFVLEPLAEIAPYVVHPVLGITMLELLANGLEDDADF